MMKERVEMVEKTCPVCGKNFIPAIQHIYRVKGKLVCTWTCMLKAEGEQEKKELSFLVGKDNIKSQTKRYSVLARRDEAEVWS